jgi:HK97 family phage major capsid protein
MTNRELREKRAKLIADAQVILRNEKRTSEDVSNTNKMLDDADAIKTEYEAVERADAMDAETRSTRPSNAPLPGNIDSPECRKAAQTEAFRNYIVSGKVSAESIRNLRSYNKTTASVVEHRDMNGDTGVDGGFLVPVGYNPEIESAKLAYGQLLTVVRDWRTNSGQPIQWPLSDDVAQFSTEMTDGTDVTESDIPLGQKTFNVSTFSTGVIKVSRSLLNDSAFDLGSFISDNFAVRMARGCNKAVTLGSTSGNVASLVTAAVSGATSAAPTAITYLDLVALYGAVDPAYISNATWAFNNTVLRQLIALEDTLGRPLFVQSMTAGIPDRILGRPFVLNQDMVSPAATTKSILLGDMSKYVFRTVGGLEVLRLNERYAPAHQVGFVGFHRQSGGLLDAGTHPVMALTQHA